MIRIECPIPSVINPAADSADAQSVAWMRHFDLCANEVERERLSKSACGQLAARLAPGCSGPMLQIVSDFFIWNVAFDDEYCDEGPLSRQPGELARTLSLIHRSIEVPESELYAQDRYARAMLDIRRRLDERAAPAQICQWLAAMRGWFLAETWKAGNIAAGRIPSLDDYATLRLYSGGALAFPPLVTIAEGYVVSPDLLENRHVKALTEIAVSLATWMSDIVSYHKEIAREDGGHNLISVIQHENACSADRAVAEATAMCEQMMRLFLCARDDLVPAAPAELCRYLQTLGHYIRASYDWCTASERYAYGNGADMSIAIGSEPSAFPLREASSIRSIAWWWAPGQQRRSSTGTSAISR
ncbi:terpene synthase family protein [Mesorhizobium retamae]|uniref:Terpene synthase n=1 Tax=Mesorhizobium retamae TaxID=2912854 RepID=A0ABS9QM75_9HYPH|nr:hypothetical protein [Mesorhizobium sp. IRAMC:0171]MCG7508440.1 hypothetical protein [Mesorhizobium sp. IRAMC:0171]